VLRSFVTSCELVEVDPFAWFRDVLGRIAGHSVTKLDELLPHRWALQIADHPIHPGRSKLHQPLLRVFSGCLRVSRVALDRTTERTDSGFTLNSHQSPPEGQKDRCVANIEFLTCQTVKKAA
jgi:hypothetical protein